MSESFNEYWERRCKANPSLRRGDVVMKISVAAFKREVEKAFEAGAGVDAKGGPSLFDDLLGRFGMGKP